MGGGGVLYGFIILQHLSLVSSGCKLIVSCKVRNASDAEVR
jgi:hypothetical protein